MAPITPDKTYEYMRYLAHTVERLEYNVAVLSNLYGRMAKESEILTVLTNAVAELLIIKGVFTEEELKAQVGEVAERMEQATKQFTEKMEAKIRQRNQDELMNSDTYGNA